MRRQHYFLFIVYIQSLTLIHWFLSFLFCPVRQTLNLTWTPFSLPFTLSNRISLPLIIYDKLDPVFGQALAAGQTSDLTLEYFFSCGCKINPNHHLSSTVLDSGQWCLCWRCCCIMAKHLHCGLICPTLQT